MNRSLKPFAATLIASLVALASSQSLCAAATPSGQLSPDITVAADGSGDFKSVQAAIDSIPKTNTERKIIFIKNGTYDGLPPPASNVIHHACWEKTVSRPG